MRKLIKHLTSGDFRLINGSLTFTQISEDTISIESEKIDTVLGYLNAYAIEIPYGKNSEVIWSHQVRIKKWNGTQPISFVKEAYDFFKPQTDQQVYIHVPHKKTANPIDDGNINIFIWSSSNSSASNETPSNIYGIPVSCRDESFNYSGNGYLLYDDENNYEVGEIIGNNIYIFHDVCHNGEPDEFKLFRKILEKAWKIMTSEDKNQYKPNPDNTEKIKAEFISLAKKNLLDSLGDSESLLLNEIPKNHKQARHKTKNSNDALEFYELKDAIEKEKLQQDEKQIEKEIINLVKHPQVLNLDTYCDDNIFFIEIITNNLVANAQNNEQAYQIGNYLIRISQFSFTCQSITTPQDTKIKVKQPAPRLINTNILWDKETVTLILEFLNNLEYVKTFELFLDMLQNKNTGIYEQLLTEFPLVS